MQTSDVRRQQKPEKPPKTDAHALRKAKKADDDDEPQKAGLVEKIGEAQKQPRPALSLPKAKRTSGARPGWPTDDPELFALSPESKIVIKGGTVKQSSMADQQKLHGHATRTPANPRERKRTVKQAAAEAKLISRQQQAMSSQGGGRLRSQSRQARDQHRLVAVSERMTPLVQALIKATIQEGNTRRRLCRWDLGCGCPHEALRQLELQSEETHDDAQTMGNQKPVITARKDAKPTKSTEKMATPADAAQL
jgi:hypothetical protein